MTLEEIIHSVGYTPDGTKANFSFNEAMLIAQRYAQSQTQELQEQNAELFEMLRCIVEKQFDSKYSLQSLNSTISEAKELLTKYNHLNKKP